MTDNYAKIVDDNLARLFEDSTNDLAKNLPAKQNGNQYIFRAFGDTCTLEPTRIRLGESEYSSVLGILISLYALNNCSDICVPLPFKSFKEFPGSMPYIGAFRTHTEQPLISHVAKIKENIPRITNAFNGELAPSGTGGDFSFVVYPLPKIALCYIFYEADDEFPASTTCLFSNNANQFLPMDGLADVGEYTSKKVLTLID
jgi:hypothetical protein